MSYFECFVDLLLPLIGRLVDLHPLVIEQKDVTADLFDDVSRFLLRSQLHVARIRLWSKNKWVMWQS